MHRLFIDIETYSPVSIKSGVYRYAEDVEVILVGYAVDDEPVRVWDVTRESIHTRLNFALREGYTLVAHNAGFERVVLTGKNAKGWRFDGHNLRWECTMARARAHGLPAGLGMLSAIYGLGDKGKDPGARKILHLFCKPQPDGSRATRETHPEKWAAFMEYCRRDVEAERVLYYKLPRWNCTESERQLWLLDQKINDRGFAVDVEFAKAAIAAIKKEKTGRDAQTRAQTEGAVGSANQRDALIKYLLDVYGVTLPDMQQDTLRRRIEDPDLPEPVRELLRLRLDTSGTATAKYNALVNAVSSDGRLRGTLAYCGAARTGRWSGSVFQPQNLARPSHSRADIELGIDAIKAGVADVIWKDVKGVATSALRGAIVAPEGKKLVVSDLSSIEGRVLAWVAYEDWKLEAYRNYDRGIGYDRCTLTYAKTFGKAPEDVTKAERQLGKVLELALGYGGGVGAFMTFAKVYHINLDDLAKQLDKYDDGAVAEARCYWKVAERKYGMDEDTFVACDAIKRMWREANPRISALWKAVENGVREILCGESLHQLGNRISVVKVGSWLRIHMQSGRYLCYAGAKIGKENKIKYLGINQYTRKWEPLTTYGGKLVENIVQAISRDILAHGMVDAENAGYRVVLSVHDELITEVPDESEYTHERLSEIMSNNPAWAKGLPLAAAGFESKRYRKD
jgi:DNA polymerase